MSFDAVLFEVEDWSHCKIAFGNSKGMFNIPKTAVLLDDFLVGGFF